MIGPITTPGSCDTASANACLPQRIVRNTRVTGVTVTTVVAVTAAVLAVSTVIVVVEPEVLIAEILAPEAIPVPAILSPTSERVAITADEATPKVKGSYTGKFLGPLLKKKQ